MKLSTVIPPVFLLLLPYASAFPSYAGLNHGSEGLKKRQVPFNPASQKIDVTGVHAFIPPGPTDLRGPCPGLNALANHGYIQRSGVTTLTESFTAAQTVYGFGPDTAAALGALGVVMAGDPISQKFSIGGPPPLTLLEQLTTIVTGRPQGLSGTHNTYESDSSATRGDSYLFNGDVSSLRLEYLEMILARSGGVDDFTPFPIWIAHRQDRFEHSIQNNPYFFFGALSGIIVGEAGIILMRELFANRSAEEPANGVLPKSVLLSFLGVTVGTNGQLSYTPGHERIPNNWYRRSLLDLYTVPEIIAQIAEIITAYPPAGSIGGNTGTVNSFVGLDLGDLTGGVFHSADLTDPNKLSCFLYRISQILAPQVVQSLFTSTIAALGLLDNWFGLFTGLGCPELHSIDQSMFAQFPGASPGKFV